MHIKWKESRGKKLTRHTKPTKNTFALNLVSGSQPEMFNAIVGLCSGVGISTFLTLLQMSALKLID